MALCLFEKISQQNPGRPSGDICNEACDRALALNCGHMVLMNNELKSVCSSVVVNAALKNQEILQNTLNETSYLFKENNMSHPQQPPQGYYPPQQGYPQQPPPQGYYPQQPPQGYYTVQPPVQQPTIPPYVAAQTQMPQELQTNGGREYPKPKQERQQPRPVPIQETKSTPVEKTGDTKGLQELCLNFEGNEMNREEHRMVLCGVPIDLNNAVRFRDYSETVFQLRKIQSSGTKEASVSNSDILVLSPEDVDFASPKQVLSKMKINPLLDKNGSIRRVFCKEKIECMSNVSSYMANSVYGERDLEKMRSRLRLLLDTIARSDEEDANVKMVAVIGIDNYLTKLVNDVCEFLGIADNKSIIDSFMSDWGDLLKYIKSNDENKIDVLIDLVTYYTEKSMEEIQKDKNNFCVGIVSHTVTAVALSSVELGFDIKTDSGWMKIKSSMTPLLAHLCSSLGKQSSDLGLAVYRHWLVTSDYKVYELSNVYKESYWKIKMVSDQ